MNGVLRKLICFSLLIALASAACNPVDANCQTCPTADGPCTACNSGFFLKNDGTCISAANCGVTGGTEAALYQTAAVGSTVAKCATGTECEALTGYWKNDGAQTQASPRKCDTCPTSCNEGTTSNGGTVSCTAVSGKVSCTVCNAYDSNNPTTKPKYYLKDWVTGALATDQQRTCVTATDCTSNAGFYKEEATTRKCRNCPSSCNEKTGSCIDTSVADATPKCYICNVAVTTNVPNPPIWLKDDGTCTTEALCTTAITPATAVGALLYKDSSNSLQIKCTACPGECNEGTTGTPATGTCDASNLGGCVLCDAATPFLRDGSTPSSKKTCVADQTSCPTTGSYSDLYVVTNTADVKKCTVTAASSASTASVTASYFNSTPNLVINAGGNSTDNTNWAVPVAYVKFGAGATNATVLAYGIKITTSGGISSINGVVTRTINATIVSNGTDSTEASVISGGSVVSVTWPSLSVSSTAGTDYSILTEAVAGYYIVAFSGFESQWTNNLYAYAWGSAGASTSGKVQITNVANPSSSVNYQYTPTSIWLEDGVVYISYIQTKYTYSAANTGSVAILYGIGGASSSDVGAYVQGFSATTGTPFYNDTAGKSSPKAVYTSETNKVGLALKCGPQNYSNSTYINCMYNAGTDSDKYSLYFVSVTRSSGAVGSASAVATASYSGDATYPRSRVQWYPAGLMTGAYASGGLYYAKNTSTTSSTSGSTYAYGLYYWNTTSGNGVWGASGISASGATWSGNSISASGGTYGLGYYIQAVVDTSSSTTASSVTTYTWNNAYQIAAFFANGTTNGSAVTLANLESSISGTGSQATMGVKTSSANYFLDKNGTVWFGYATGEKSKASSGTPAVAQGNIYAGYVGKVVGQIFIGFGSVLSTFFAFLSLVLFTLFAF